jgi:hypothetical protein
LRAKFREYIVFQASPVKQRRRTRHELFGRGKGVRGTIRERVNG